MRLWETLWWERCHPWIIALMVVVAFVVMDVVFDKTIRFPGGGDVHFLLGASITAGSIFTSFLATSLAFLSGVKTPLAKRLRETKYNDEVLSYFKWAILGALALCLCSLCGAFINTGTRFYLYVWVFLVVFAGLAFWRCTSLLLKVLHNPKPKF